MFSKFFESRRRKKFIRESIEYFYLFGEKAGLTRYRIDQIIPQDQHTFEHVRKMLESGNWKPIDIAMVMTDLCIRELERKKAFFESDKAGEIFSEKTKDISDLLGMESGSEMMQAMIDQDFKDIEKIQFQAFDLGPKLGSKIVLQEGFFKGRFDEFSKPADY